MHLRSVQSQLADGLGSVALVLARQSEQCHRLSWRPRGDWAVLHLTLLLLTRWPLALVMFDYIVVTAASTRQAAAYEAELRDRALRGDLPATTRAMAVADPSGERHAPFALDQHYMHASH